MKKNRQSSFPEIIDFFNAVQAWVLKGIHATGWIGVVLLFGGGVIAWASFNYVLEETNTETFCISCHEMKSTSYEEYRTSTHAMSRSGMRATCPDCHVAKPFGPKMVAKIRASKDLYHSILGTINTTEKFEARRLEMAEAVWARMKETDSRECRNCHDNLAFDFAKQSRRAVQQHEEGINEGKTCIDCHKGITHKLPNIEQNVGAEKGGVAPEIFHPPVPAAASQAKH